MTGSADQILDVAIVGGGVSGVYCGWRLLSDAPQAPDSRPTVALFEGSHRIGGRLASFTAPRMPHVVGELGGMQFLSSHPLVSALVMHRLGLPVTSFPLNTTLDCERPKNISYLRGRHLLNQQLTDPQLVPYGLTWSERGRDPTMLLGDALELLFPGITDLSGSAFIDFLKKAHLSGPGTPDKPLYQWGFWNLLTQILSQEACEFIRDSLGYEFLLSNYNASVIIQQFKPLFPKVIYYGITDGYDQLPLTMAAQFEASGGTLHKGWRLLSFAPAQLQDGSNGVSLTFCTNNQGWGSDPCATEKVTVLARSLILALPRRALELITPTWQASENADPHISLDIQSRLALVTPLPMFKVFLCYPYPWWKRVSPKGGIATSDLPVQQCTYWGVEKGNNCALTMASLNDSQNVSFWEGLRDAVPLDHSDGTSDQGSENWRRYTIPADGSLALEAHRQLLLIHGVDSAPRPYAAAAADWSVDPYGGAVHYWQQNVNYWEVSKTVLHPNQKLPIFICGEAYSCNQGWAEGALETAEEVLEHQDFPYRLAPPGWLQPATMRALG